MKYSKEAKQAFFDAFLTYRNAGETFVGAYSHARSDFNAAHKLAPNLWTFRKWYKEAMTGKNAKTEEPEETAAETEAAAEDIPEEASDKPKAEEVPDEEAIQPPDDYTARLELICRMYRTHSEESRDAICDYLLPELWQEGAEE